jgi:hypothetical protein
MPIPSALVTRFFQLLVNRQFTEAERELERLKQKMQKTEWNRGYFRALYGMFLSRKANGDSYALFSKMDLNDRLALNSYRREFQNHVRSRFHGDFDRGFFSAWADCMRVLTRISVPNSVSASSSQDTSSIEEKPDLAKSEGNQTTIEGYIKEEAD